MEMEMQQRSFNIYVDAGQREEGSSYRTEDIYQCLQGPPTAPSRRPPEIEQSASDKYGMRKMMLLPFIIIILLLTAILCIVVAHYHHFRVQLGSGQNTNGEAWVLNEDAFYLFWTDYGDCFTAKNFCKKRGANLVVVEEHNMDWLKSQINGKSFLVRADQSEGSGNLYNTYMDNEDYGCEVFGATSNLDVKHVGGWVCERAAK